jgi:hypothetical protein
LPISTTPSFSSRPFGAERRAVNLLIASKASRPPRARPRSSYTKQLGCFGWGSDGRGRQGPAGAPAPFPPERSRSGCEPTLSVRRAIDLLYDVRCDVVHEGAYFNFTLARAGDTTRWLTPSRTGSLIPTISIQDIRQVVLEGSVLGAGKLLPPGNPSAQLVT